MAAFRMTRALLARRGSSQRYQLGIPPEDIARPGTRKDESIEEFCSRNPLLAEMMRPMKPLPPLPAEEQQRLRKLMVRYGKLKRLQYLDMELRMNRAKHAMWAAIDALPHNRRVEAVHSKPPPYPDDVRVFTDTPPIKGFDRSNLTKRTNK